MENNLQIENVAVSALLAYEKNAKKHPPKQIEQVAKSIQEFGFLQPLVVDKNNVVIVGHGRLLAAKKLELKEVPILRAEYLTPEQVQAYRIADNKLNESDWDLKLLHEELKSIDIGSLDLKLTGFDTKFLLDLETQKQKLSDLFLVSPFSVLDTRLGEWLNRKRAWRAVIDDNGESRERVFIGSENYNEKNVVEQMAGASLLDPVLAEVLCRWFTKEGFNVFDPFAGDTVFGFVSAKCGLNFTGIELREAQVHLNQMRCEGLKVNYICADARSIDEHIQNESQDFLFTCPPYADLEVYSNDPRDLSTMGTEEFFVVLGEVLTKTYAKLKQNRFAAVVVSEVRGKDGNFIGLVPKTIEIMQRAGYSYYNECILVNAIGTLPMRAGRIMNASRKVGRMHQNVLVFYKGDPAEIKNNFPVFTKYESADLA